MVHLSRWVILICFESWILLKSLWKQALLLEPGFIHVEEYKGGVEVSTNMYDLLWLLLVVVWYGYPLTYMHGIDTIGAFCYSIFLGEDSSG